MEKYSALFRWIQILPEGADRAYLFLNPRRWFFLLPLQYIVHII